MKLNHSGAAITLLFPAWGLTGCRSSMAGRYEDSGHHYVDFHRGGKAFTNIGAGGGEVQITYDVDGDRVTLHQIDGNPTLRVHPDRSLCCGPSGVLAPTVKN